MYGDQYCTIWGRGDRSSTKCAVGSCQDGHILQGSPGHILASGCRYWWSIIRLELLQLAADRFLKYFLGVITGATKHVEEKMMRSGIRVSCDEKLQDMAEKHPLKNCGYGRKASFKDPRSDDGRKWWLWVWKHLPWVRRCASRGILSQKSEYRYVVLSQQFGLWGWYFFLENNRKDAKTFKGCLDSCFRFLETLL